MPLGKIMELGTKKEGKSCLFLGKSYLFLGNSWNKDEATNCNRWDMAQK